MKYMRTFSILFFVLISPSFSIIHAHNYLIRLAQAITTKSYRNDRESARQLLLKQFKGTEFANAHTLSTMVTSYHHKHKTLLYPTHADTLHDAIDRFNQKPGFARKMYELLCNVNSKSFIKGHMYELEMALALDTQGETLTHFGYAFYCPLTRVQRSIDLVTESNLIECKNIHWNAYRSKSQDSTIKLKEQLLSYQALSENAEYDDRPFVLYSKQRIPSTWKKWLHDNEIEYCDD